MSGDYRDPKGVDHLNYENPICELWRQLMKHHMDVCHAAGLDAITSANLLLNGAAYVLGASLSEEPERRVFYQEKMVDIFRGKVERAVSEGRADRARGPFT